MSEGVSEAIVFKNVGYCLLTILAPLYLGSRVNYYIVKRETAPKSN